MYFRAINFVQRMDAPFIKTHALCSMFNKTIANLNILCAKMLKHAHKMGVCA